MNILTWMGHNLVVIAFMTVLYFRSKSCATLAIGSYLFKGISCFVESPA